MKNKEEHVITTNLPSGITAVRIKCTPDMEKCMEALRIVLNSNTQIKKGKESA